MISHIEGCYLTDACCGEQVEHMSLSCNNHAILVTIMAWNGEHHVFVRNFSRVFHLTGPLA